MGPLHRGKHRRQDPEHDPSPSPPPPCIFDIGNICYGEKFVLNMYRIVVNWVIPVKFSVTDPDPHFLTDVVVVYQCTIINVMVYREN